MEITKKIKLVKLGKDGKSIIINGATKILKPGRT